MTCPKCKSTKVDSGNNCPHCKVDAVLYTRITRLSDRLYNHGLEKLSGGDMYYGIEALQKSISISKDNIKARNLLGLALLEIGHVGEAIMHWHISSTLAPDENPAESYAGRVKNNIRSLEKYNDSISMYNIALHHIKQKSDDLAIIQLKRAVDNNPNFIDGLNLLALCYVIQNDKDRAISVVERVLSLDINNPIALNYLNILNPKGKGMRSLPPSVKAAQPRAAENAAIGPYKSASVPSKKPSGFPIMEIITFLLGAASAVAVFHFLLMPEFTRNHENDIARLEQQAVYVAEGHQREIDDILEDKNDLDLIIEGLYAQINQFELAAELQVRIDSVFEAAWMLDNDQLHEAVNLVNELDTTGMSFQHMEMINSIRENAYPRLATQHFTTGFAAFQANDFYLALVELEIAARFISDEMTVERRDFMRALGTLYYNEGRDAEALALLEPLREHFPQHFPNTVQSMINNINNRS